MRVVLLFLSASILHQSYWNMAWSTSITILPSHGKPHPRTRGPEIQMKGCQIMIRNKLSQPTRPRNLKTRLLPSTESKLSTWHAHKPTDITYVAPEILSSHPLQSKNRSHPTRLNVKQSYAPHHLPAPWPVGTFLPTNTCMQVHFQILSTVYLP